MSAVALPFQLGARTLATVTRDLVLLRLSLDEVLAGTPPRLPDLDGDGYLITSLPAAALPALQTGGLTAKVRQRYVRHYTDLGIGHESWLASLSASARSTLRRKTKKAAAHGMAVRAYRTPAEFATFYPLARAISARTYQERLLDAGLPVDAPSVEYLQAAAAADKLRAWLLLIGGEPVAYLCGTAQGSALRYDHVGHDPALAHLSPGTLLQAAAIEALFADRFALFDFLEGDGQHKRLFASAGVACVDLLLLRPTLANRAAAGALTAFDGAAALAKRAGGHPALAGLAARVRR